jgi:hypothetical protein
VPVALASLVAKMMAKDPSRRFQTPAELTRALAPFFKTDGQLLTPPELTTADANVGVVDHVPAQVAQTSTAPADAVDRMPVSAIESAPSSNLSKMKLASVIPDEDTKGKRTANNSTSDLPNLRLNWHRRTLVSLTDFAMPRLVERPTYLIGLGVIVYCAVVLFLQSLGAGPASLLVGLIIVGLFGVGMYLMSLMFRLMFWLILTHPIVSGGIVLYLFVSYLRGPQSIRIAVVLSPFLLCYGIILAYAMTLASVIPDEATEGSRTANNTTSELPNRRLHWRRRALVSLTSLARLRLTDLRSILLLISLGLIVSVSVVHLLLEDMLQNRLLLLFGVMSLLFFFGTILVGLLVLSFFDEKNRAASR